MDFPLSVIPQSHILHAPFSTGVQRQFSRYFNEFEELQLLGKGAFGAVIKVGPKAFLDDVTLASKLSVDLTFSLPLSLSCNSRFRITSTVATTR